MSSRVWREDPGPLRSLIEHYAARPDSDDPWFQQAAHRSRLRHMQREVAAGFPVAARPAVRALLRHAARTLPIRGVGKRSFLQALDVARASARRIGRLHTDGGRLNYPDDVFYLAVPEVVHLPAAARDLVELRRKRRAGYQHLDLPTYWRGTPNPIRLEPAGEYADAPDVVTGIGVSAGCVQGRVRVVTDPGFGDVQAGEILVAPSTDPSWASIMFISAGLVIDMGSAISHAAVVARELGLPCVVNTRTGTRVLRDGDLVSVDGTSGHVAVLERAAGRVEP
jgi:pyruvate,water dikinase